MKVHFRVPLAFGVIFSAVAFASFVGAEDYYTGEKVYRLRPNPKSDHTLGPIGPTGIMAHVEIGVKVTVTKTAEGSPAEGKFNAGEVILAVNGKELEGLNPYVVLGSAITEAEAKDGRLVFKVEEKNGERRNVEVEVPVLGAYGENWPLDCPKSKKIIEGAAEFYSKWVSESKDTGIPTALACLYLLSTGDDSYLPVVKAHFQKFVDRPQSVGDHTWNNGYNGIACAEYYLRTGDEDMLPVLQAFCDDARDRQNFNSAWKHWGSDINPSYVAGGLMNPASTQVLTTLLLCKEAGVDVDEATLINALRYFYRFVGHGSVPYGDHRGEGGVGSNGKNAMTAVAMQVATDTSGDASIYKSARDCLSMNTLTGYPDMITGHGDNGRGDGIWRGISSSYLIGKSPEKYREVMDRIRWWYDLSRYHDGAVGLATCKSFNDPGSGAGAAMTYTAPMKTLRITGAPRSKHAKEFKLPDRLWGKQADLVFHSIEPVSGMEKYGKPMAMHEIDALLGSAYSKGVADSDPDSISADQLQRLVRHQSYMVRTQAAKTLRKRGDISVIEDLLEHDDPRVRRAALDGIIDWNYFFNSGKNTLTPEDFTSDMIESITGMLVDPEEAAYVAEGALFAIGYMPAEVIKDNFMEILPWTKSEDWWFRHASFMALQGLQRDPDIYETVAPLLTEMMVQEVHTMPRQAMDSALAKSLKHFGSDSEIGEILVQGFETGVTETEVLEGRRGREGRFNISSSIGQAAKYSPEVTPQLASLLVQRGLSELDNDELLQLVRGGSGFAGFTAVSKKLKGAGRKSLEDTLYEYYRPELAKRLKASGGTDIGTIDAILAILSMRDGDIGWKALGEPGPAKRNWKYTSIDPIEKKDILVKRTSRRYRQITLPEDMEDWFKPDFDTRGWESGKAPIGKGGHPRGRKDFKFESPWGDGEFLLARTNFEFDGADYDFYRLRILCNQGFNVYLNGEKIQSYSWWADANKYRDWPIGERQAKLLKKGTNTIAVYTMLAYPSAAKAHWKDEVFGELDCYIEGLRKEDLY